MKKNVCIIGAGPAGLNAAYRCLQAGHKFTVFEQTDKIGGTWVYTPELNQHTSMYEDLLLNGPKEVTYFDGFPFPDNDENEKSFVPSALVLKYLEDFAKPIQEYILFSHKVIKVSRVDNQWKVLVAAADGGLKSIGFDAIFVCIGHFFEPNLPEFVKQYEGKWVHSHNYRKATHYQNQTVAVVGAGTSGMDIVGQVAKVAKKVYFLHTNAGNFTAAGILPANIEEAKRPVGANKNSLVLADGSTLGGLDNIIFCTGYLYKYPFFEEKIEHVQNGKINGSLFQEKADFPDAFINDQTNEKNNHSEEIIKILYGGQVVSPLFEHVAHVEYLDSLFFICLNSLVLNFLLIDYQVHFAIALMEGRASGFTKEDVSEWEAKRFRELEEKNLPIKQFHTLGMAQFDYYKKLAKYSGIKYFTLPVAERIFELTGINLRLNFLTFRNSKIRIIDEKNCIWEKRE